MAKPKINPASLNQDEKDLLLESVFELKPVYETAKLLGFTSKSAFAHYLTRNDPEFKKILADGRIEACSFIEDRYLNIPNEFKDFKMAKIVAEIYAQVLSWRIPSKYSQKFDLNINQTVSIQHNLASANDRIKQVYQLAIPAMISDKSQDKPQAALETEKIEVSNGNESKD